MEELVVPASIAFIIFIIAWLKKKDYAKTRYSIPLFFISAGLAASVPLSLTYVQRGFYLVPSFPYFAIGISSIIAPVILLFTIKLKTNRKHLLILSVSAVLIFSSSVIFSLMQIGKTQRDRDILHDVHLIGNNLPYGTEVSVNQDIAATHVLECYFVRYYYISLYIDKPKDYLLLKKPETPEASSGFEKINLETRIYDVYKKTGE
jgi:hypothetical protein